MAAAAATGAAASSGLAVLGGGNVESDSALAADCRYVAGAGIAAPLVTLLAPFVATPSAQADDVVHATEAFGEEHGLKAKPLRGAARTFLILLRGAAKYGVGADGLRQDLMALGVDEGAAREAGRAWGAVAPRVNAALAGAAAAGTAPALVDATWRFGVTVSSDDLAKIGTTYVQLALTVDRGGRLVREVVELSLPQFYAMLASLERAKSYVDYLSGTAEVAAAAAAAAAGAAGPA